MDSIGFYKKKIAQELSAKINFTLREANLEAQFILQYVLKQSTSNLIINKNESILKKDGSVQHLDFPTKAVFKSFIEITPKELILQAAQRQEFIDQSQSLNLMIHPSVSAKDINALYLYAHEEGVKTLYYQFSQSSAQAFSRNILDCASCEG